MGYGCGCGHTNQLLSNRPLGGSPMANLFKNSMIGTGQNHVGAEHMFQTLNRPGGNNLFSGANIVKGILRRGR